LRDDLFQKRMLKRIFRLSREENAGDLINLHSYEFNHLYTSPNINGVDKMDGFVARRTDERYNTSDHLKEKASFVDLYVNVRIILKLM
jgi:hypothetical protein